MEKCEIVLAAFAAGGENAGYSPVQVQKVLFLIDRKAAELVGGPHFDFVPYDYGPFDRGVYDVIDELAADGLAEKRDLGRYREYALTSDGYARGLAELDGLDERSRNYLRRLVKWVRDLTFEQLVSAVYKMYPDMQVNSIFRA